MAVYRRLLLASALALVASTLVPVYVSLVSLAATAHQAQMSDGFVDSIGVNTHLYFTDTQYGNYSAYAPLLEASGIRHIRDGNGNPTVNSRGAYYYPLLQDLAHHGIHTTWINDPRNGTQTVQQMVGNIATVGPGVVEAMEGPNEYDASGDTNWAADLRAFQQQLYSDTKAANPTLPVIGPSVSASDAQTLGDISAYVDQANMHPYALWPPAPLSTILDNEIYYHQTYAFPGRPLAATEFGYPTASQAPGSAYSVSEAVQAKYVARAFLEAFSRGVARTWDFQLLDGTNDATNQEANFGLIRSDNSLKPSYHALQNLIGLLADPGPVFAPGSLAYDLSGSTGNVHQLLLQKRNRTFELILWLDPPSTPADVSQLVTIGFGRSTAVTAHLPLVSASVVGNYPNVQTVTVAIPDHPLVLDLSEPRVVSSSASTPMPAASTATAPPTLDPLPPRVQPARHLRNDGLPFAPVAATAPASDARSTPWTLLALGLAIVAVLLMRRRRRSAETAGVRKGKNVSTR